MACPRLATHSLAGLCAPWLPSAASTSESLHNPAKPQPPQTTRTALAQPPVLDDSQLLHTAEAAFDLAVPHGMPGAGHSHTGRALCAVVAECCLLLWTAPQTGKPATPTSHLPGPAAGPSAGPTPTLRHTAEATFDLALPHGMPRAGHSHTGRALCAVVAECCLLLWKSP